MNVHYVLNQNLIRCHYYPTKEAAKNLTRADPRSLTLSYHKGKVAPICGDGELVGGVHSLVGGVVQVHQKLQVLEEKNKARKVEKEIEKKRPHARAWPCR